MTQQKTISVGSIRLNNNSPMVLMAGLNVLENRDMAMQVATHIKEVTAKLNIPFIFKASFDKANRSSVHSYRGPGLDEGLKILDEIKKSLSLPIITDIHNAEQAKPVADVADILQIPAFLCRQTDLVKAAAVTDAVINVKKMQIMAAWDVENIFKKFAECGNEKILMCERGTAFGYNNLVVDPLAFPELKKFGYPVVFDVTHSLQQPGGLGTATAGRGEHVETLAIAGMSTGIAALFLETHPDPSKAKCDGPCATKLSDVENLLKRVKAFDELAKS